MNIKKFIETYPIGSTYKAQTWTGREVIAERVRGGAIITLIGLDGRMKRVLAYNEKGRRQK